MTHHDGPNTRGRDGRGETGCLRSGFPTGGRGGWFAPVFTCRMLPWALLVLGVGLSSAPAEASDPETALLQKIRYWHTMEYTRVVLDLDRTVKYETGRVGADRAAGLPERIYVDLFATACAGGVPEKIELDKGPVHCLRTSWNSHRSGRLVLDLRHAGRYKVFRLDRPHRIVIDLWWDEPPPQQEGRQAPGSPPAAVSKPDPKAPRLPLVVLDPGHGGSDPGAIGPKGLMEKDVVLAIARDLKRILEERGAAQVILTRNGDTHLSLHERTRIANSQNADLFISIHANASTQQKIRGVETYYLDNTTDRAAIRLAALENRSAGAQIDDLSCILRDLRLSSNANESHILARTVQRSLMDTLRKRYRAVEDLGAKGNLFFVLIGAHMPSVLVEVSYLSNPAEEKRLKEASYRGAIARGIADGIGSYLEQPTVSRLLAGVPGGDGDL